MEMNKCWICGRLANCKDFGNNECEVFAEFFPLKTIYRLLGVTKKLADQIVQWKRREKEQVVAEVFKKMAEKLSKKYNVEVFVKGGGFFSSTNLRVLEKKEGVKMDLHEVKKEKSVVSDEALELAKILSEVDISCKETRCKYCKYGDYSTPCSEIQYAAAVIKAGYKRYGNDTNKQE